MLEEKALDKRGNMTFSVVTAPTVEPATVDEFKTFARIDTTGEDSFLEMLIKAAREAGEFYTNAAFLEQTVRVRMDYWPKDKDHIELPLPPLISLSKFVTVDEDDTETAYSSDSYFIITDCVPAKLCIAYGATPPTNEDRRVGGIMIEYIAGYGSTAAYVPSIIRLAVQMWATVGYEKRVYDFSEPPAEVKKMLSPFRILNV